MSGGCRTFMETDCDAVFMSGPEVDDLFCFFELVSPSFI